MIEKIKILDKTWPSGLVDFLYPPVCLTCNAFLENPDELICKDCLDNITELDLPFCSICRQFIQSGIKCPDCEESGLPVFCLGRFTDVLQTMVHQLKYYGFSRLGSILAECVVKKYLPALEKLQADYIVPVPLHSTREKSRGYNQAAVLADNIGNGTGIETLMDILVRTKKTKDQTRLNPEQRRKNIKGAFEVIGGNLIGKRVILVDDVVTTGATANEAAVTLRRAGAKPVAVCAVAAAGL